MYIFNSLIIATMFIVVSNIEVAKLLKEKKGVEIYEFHDNKATAYSLSDGKFLIVPQNGDSSLLFENETSYIEFLKKPEFPKPQNQPFYNYKSHFKNIEKNISYFYDLINSALQTQISQIKSETDMRSLFEKLNNYRKTDSNYFDNLIIPLGITIGEYLKKKHSMRWSLSPVYAFDVYYIPVLKNDKGIQFSFWSILEEYYENDFFDVDDFLWKIDLFDKMNKSNFREK